MSATISTAPDRRVVTEPIPHILRRTAQATEDISNTDLFKYDNPNIKVFSFSIPRDFDKTGSAAGQHEAGTIPWKSRSDRLVTVGHLRLYRAPSEALMIDSGDKNWRLPMMPGSRCWCVDNEAVFAMKLLDKIYRIELPSDSSDEKAKVAQFKTVLSSTIRYEKDACPFKRGFDVATAMEDAGSPVARRQLIGTLRDPAKRYNLDGSREPRRPSTARTDASLDVSDDDLEAVISPVDVHHTRQADVSSATANDVSLVDSPQSISRLKERDKKRSVTAPLLGLSDTAPVISSAVLEPQATNDSPGLERTSLILPTEAEENDDLYSSSVMEHDDPSVITLASTKSLGVDALLSVMPIPDSTTKTVTPNEEFPEKVPPSSSFAQPELELQPQPVPSSQSTDLVDIVQPLDSAQEVITPLMRTEILDCTPDPSTAPSLPANLSSERNTTPPPTRRVSASSVDAPRVLGTNPNQPPGKSAPTTTTSTVTSSFRHSSMSSDDDVPSLGLFSQTLNVLLGPPSGLMSVLIGFARRVGSYSRGTGSRGLGLGASPSEWEGVSRSQRRAGMPGSWDSEDERDSPSASEVDNSASTEVTNGLKKTRSWASASETATGQNGATKSSGQRPVLNREWTDDDLD